MSQNGASHSSGIGDSKSQGNSITEKLTQLHRLKENLQEHGLALKKLVNSLDAKEEVLHQAEVKVKSLAKQILQLEKKASSQAVFSNSLVGLIAQHEGKLKALAVLLPKGKSALSHLKQKHGVLSKDQSFWFEAVSSLNQIIETEARTLAALIHKNSESDPRSLALLQTTKRSEIAYLERDLAKAVKMLTHHQGSSSKNFEKVSKLEQILDISGKKSYELEVEKTKLTNQLSHARKVEKKALHQLVKLRAKLHAHKEQSAYYRQGTVHLERELSRQRKTLANIAEKYSITRATTQSLKEKSSERQIKVNSNDKVYPSKMAQQVMMTIKGQESQIKNMDSVIKECESHIDRQQGELSVKNQVHWQNLKRLKQAEEELKLVRLALQEAKKTIIIKNKILKKLNQENRALKLDKAMGKLSRKGEINLHSIPSTHSNNSILATVAESAN